MDLKSKCSFLLKPSQRYFVISPFIPKNLVFLTSPKRKEKSPLRVVEAYNKEKPNAEDAFDDFKYFKSLKPKQLNFVNPDKVRAKYFERANRFKNCESENIQKMKPKKEVKKNNLSSLTPKSENKAMKGSSGESSNDFDYLNIYRELL